MKLYLSSYQFGNHANQLLGLLGENRHAAIIMNAGDSFGDANREKYRIKYASALSELGLTAEELDLRTYFGRGQQLEPVLNTFGLIWVVGGNTFTLRRAMRESGMDAVLPKLLADTEIVYGGFSAGACVLAPSLRGIHWVDEPEDVPPDYPSPAVIWEGLGLIDFSIAPHYRSPHAESAAIENVVAHYEMEKMPYVALEDGEAVVIDSGEVLILRNSSSSASYLNAVSKK